MSRCHFLNRMGEYKPYQKMLVHLCFSQAYILPYNNVNIKRKATSMA